MNQAKPDSTRLVVVKTESRLENTRYLGAAAHSIAREAGLSSQDAATVEICVVEAARNVLRLAFQNEPGNQVQATFHTTEQELQLEIRCDGKALDGLPEKSASGYEPAMLENLPEGGLGWHLIYQTMDRVSCGSTGGSSVLSLTKSIL